MEILPYGVIIAVVKADRQGLAGLSSGRVAVGTAVAHCPPHRTSARAPNAHGSHLRSAFRSIGFLTHAHLPCVCPLVRHGVRCGYRLVSVLLGQQPSLHGLLRPSLACVPPLHQYYAAARLPAAVHVGLIALRLLPPFRPSLAAEGHRVSRFSCVKFPCMHGVFDSAGPKAYSRLRTPQCGLPCSLTPSAPGLRDFGAHQLQGYPAYTSPVQRFQGDLTASPGMARGQDGSLLLSCMTLSFTTSRRFIPTHPS